MALRGIINAYLSTANPTTIKSGISTQMILSSLDVGFEYFLSGSSRKTLSTEDNSIVSCSNGFVITLWHSVDAFPIVLFQKVDGDYIYTYISYLKEDGTPTVELMPKAKNIPIMTSDSMVQPTSSINLSTVDPDTTIEALVDGTMTEINNTPKTVDITNGDVIIDVSTHSPKDKYTVQVNNGDNMLRIVDGSTQYNSFPASVPVQANKTLTAYGEADKEITINYTNTGTPVVTNT